jgi:hypothetical protein
VVAESFELAAFRHKWLPPKMAGAFLIARMGERAPRAVCRLCRQQGTLHPMYLAGRISASRGELEAASRFGPPRLVFQCKGCQQETKPAFEKARLVVRELFPRGGRLATEKQLRGAHAAVLVIGEELEGALLLRRGRPRAGRPERVAESFSLYFLHLQGVQDGKLAKVLGRSPRYVKDRRERSLFQAKSWMREFSRYN